MNEVLEVIRRRRSVRKFSEEKLPVEVLEAIIEAGRQAPCGGNNRTTHFMVIQDETVCGAVALGYPETRTPRADGERGGNPVTYI